MLIKSKFFLIDEIKFSTHVVTCVLPKMYQSSFFVLKLGLAIQWLYKNAYNKFTRRIKRRILTFHLKAELHSITLISYSTHMKIALEFPGD